jgi:hypothetical protein
VERVRERWRGVGGEVKFFSTINPISTKTSQKPGFL